LRAWNKLVRILTGFDGGDGLESSRIESADAERAVA
jgi:hypothetical protein